MQLLMYLEYPSPSSSCPVLRGRDRECISVTREALVRAQVYLWEVARRGQERDRPGALVRAL